MLEKIKESLIICLWCFGLAAFIMFNATTVYANEPTIVQELIDTSGLWLFLIGVVGWMWRQISDIKANHEKILNELRKSEELNKNILADIEKSSSAVSKEHSDVDTKLSEIFSQHGEHDKIQAETLSLVKIIQRDMHDINKKK
jgi:hypothetical protein